MNDDDGASRRPPRGRVEPGAADYVAAVRRHWPVALGTFAVVVLASLVATWLVDPVYRSSARVLVRTEDSAQLFPRLGDPDGSLLRVLTAELDFTRSDAFTDQARAAAGDGTEVDVRLDDDPSGGTAAVLGGAAPRSSTLSFVAESADASEAASAANAWAGTYVTMRQQLDVDELARLRELLVADRDALAEQRRQLLGPVTALDGVIAQTTDAVELSRLLNQRLALQRSLSVELDPIEDRLRDLDARIADIDVDSRVLQDPGALAVVNVAAEPAGTPANGSLGRNLAVGAVTGLVLGALAVPAMRLVLRRATTTDEVEGATGLPVIARVPPRGPGDVAVAAAERPASDVSEAYRTLVAALDHESLREPIHRLLVTSTSSPDDTADAAVNLAVLAGQDGTRVLLVGADLRTPLLHRAFGLDAGPGLSEVLTGRASFVDVVHEVEVAGSRLGVVLAGGPSDDPAQLLRSPAAKQVFDDDVRDFELVVHAGPPLGVVDSVVLARHVDAAVLVVPAGADSIDDVGRAARTLLGTGARVPGVVLVDRARTAAGWHR